MSTKAEFQVMQLQQDIDALRRRVATEVDPLLRVTMGHLIQRFVELRSPDMVTSYLIHQI